MATSKTSHFDMLIDKLAVVPANSNITVSANSALAATLIFVYRGSGNLSGIYVSDGWGSICPIVPCTGISISKDDSSPDIVITNNNSLALEVMTISRK